MCVCFALFFLAGGAPMCRVKLRTVKQGTSLKGIEVYGQSVVIIHNLFFVYKPFFSLNFYQLLLNYVFIYTVKC